ncbi:UDP-2,4-diacetamido-2,4,6-trideoxy-beta-L-altropyranose hydrolase [bacterium]|nr:UDP-2,4-diacetamido-2,4,6-trideoxy-beta-L-altropyranose hydrolase [bacterium]QQR59907.1 MAG: UDP-2,4-diacetamido-2,4,6-trideoxy-beta-L-altropyranose hydrolase [Candidatus Melainabacteria bacterium]
MKVLFRADASNEQGGGHVMRSLVVANEFAKRGHECFFVSIKGSFEMIPYQGSLSTQHLLHKIEIDKTNFDDCICLKSLLPSKVIPDVALVDSYLLQDNYELELSKFCRNVAALDDVPNRTHNVDILIDPTFKRTGAEYQNLLLKKAHVLAGVDYAPLREEFAGLRTSSLAKRMQTDSKVRPKNIVVSLGLSDSENVTSVIINALSKVKTDFIATIVIGKNSPYEKTIRTLSESVKSPVQMLIAHENMAELFFESDLSVGGGGSTSWERCCLGLPTLQITFAPNQEDVTTNLASVGAVFHLGAAGNLRPELVAYEIERHLADSKLLLQMSQASFNLCDGLGAERIVDEVEKRCVA